MRDATDNVAYEFGGFRLDPVRRHLTDARGDVIALKPKVFDTLTFLVEHRGELLTKTRLLEEIWAGAVVEENSLNQHVSMLRRVLNEKPGENRFIATVPGRGYQFVADVRTKATGGTKPKSLAVLPLQNLSNDASQTYLVDGMTDELIARLSRISGLRVVSRTSARVYMDSDKPVPTIAAELGVDLIVEGSVIRSSGRIRITVQLIDAAADAHVWAESFERQFADVLILQSEITQAIASKIEVALNPDEEATLGTAEVVVPEAYEAALKGLEHFYKLTPPDLEQSLRYFQHAHSLNPDSARAHVGIAHVWIGRQQMGFTPNRIATPLAKEAALRAIELDSTLADGHFILSVVKAFGEFDLAAAETYMGKALALNPSHAEARAVYSHELACLGRLEEATEQVERAIELDPFNPFFKAFFGVVLYFGERYEESIEQFSRALEIFPTLPFALQILSGAYHQLERFDEALASQRKLMTVLGNAAALEAIDAGAAAGGYRTAMAQLAEVTRQQSIEAQNGGVWAALRFTHADRYDDAFETLHSAIEQRDPNAPYLRAVFPELRPWAATPRYRDLLDRLDRARRGIYFEA